MSTENQPIEKEQAEREVEAYSLLYQGIARLMQIEDRNRYRQIHPNRIVSILEVANAQVFGTSDPELIEFGNGLTDWAKQNILARKETLDKTQQ